MLPDEMLILVLILPILCKDSSFGASWIIFINETHVSFPPKKNLLPLLVIAIFLKVIRIRFMIILACKFDE